MTEKKQVLPVYKRAGETPLEAIRRVRKEHPEYANETMTYAGRLDPLAEGVLLLLSGDAVAKKDDYLRLDKEYVFDVLFGFSTDTYDLLGKVTDTGNVAPKPADIERILKALTGSYEQQYPPYSSKTVEGKPLFMWAREGKLHEITIPTHPISVTELTLADVRTIRKDALRKKIHASVGGVRGDFRQGEILELWNAYLDIHESDTLTIANIRTKCSHGTYVRALVNELGEKLGVPATTFHIIRTKVGPYDAAAGD